MHGPLVVWPAIMFLERPAQGRHLGASVRVPGSVESQKIPPKAAHLKLGQLSCTRHRRHSPEPWSTPRSCSYGGTQTDGGCRPGGGREPRQIERLGSIQKSRCTAEGRRELGLDTGRWAEGRWAAPRPGGK